MGAVEFCFANKRQTGHDPREGFEQVAEQSSELASAQCRSSTYSRGRGTAVWNRLAPRVEEEQTLFVRRHRLDGKMAETSFDVWRETQLAGRVQR
jgi:hypothetical protein